MKALIILCIFTLAIYADNSYELKLYEMILPKIFHKERVVVYTKNSDVFLLLQKSKHLVFSNTCPRADFIMGKKFAKLSDECKNIPIFALSYRSFKHEENSFGAFYWKKGRPQIIFKLKAIKKFNLHLNHKLKKYAQ